MTYPTYHNLIGGQWLPAASGKTILNLNPADHSDVIGAFPSSHAEDVALAVAAAKKAFATWRLVPAPKRAEILLRARDILVQNKEKYARDMTREMGKVLAETRGDVQEAIDEAFYVAGEGRRLFGVTTPSELPNKFAMSVRMPVGVVGLITPWNFPMAIPSWKLFPALVAGNTCVIKPATDTPLSTYNLVQALVDAGLPPGVVNIVCGTGSAAGSALVEHPDVRAISFTGSSAVGSLVAQRAAATFKQVSLEMGGKNAQIVLDDANLDLALDGALWGAFGTTGQRCTATSRILLQKGIAAEFTAKFVARAKKLKVGNGLDESVEVGPQVNAAQIETSQQYVEIAQREGAELLCGGHALTGGAYAHGTFFEPTVFAGVTPHHAHRPRRGLRPSRRAHRVLDTSKKPSRSPTPSTTASPPRSTRSNVNRAFAAMRDLEAGITYINAPTIGAEVHLPFGGVKHTGNGHREGLGALDFFTTWKAVYVDYSDKLQRAQIDNAE